MRSEILVGEVLTVDALVELERRIGLAVLFGPFIQGVPIPLGIFADGAVGGDGVDAPVDENTELGAGIPDGGRAAIERFPIGLIGSLRGEAQSEER